MINYPCGKSDDCNFSRFGSIVRTNRHRDAHTDVDERYTPVSNQSQIAHHLKIVFLQNCSIHTV